MEGQERALGTPVPYVVLQHKAVLVDTAAASKQAWGRSRDNDEEMINSEAKPVGLLSLRTARWR